MDRRNWGFRAESVLENVGGEGASIESTLLRWIVETEGKVTAMIGPWRIAASLCFCLFASTAS